MDGNWVKTDFREELVAIVLITILGAGSAFYVIRNKGNNSDNFAGAGQPQVLGAADQPAGNKSNEAVIVPATKPPPPVTAAPSVMTTPSPTASASPSAKPSATVDPMDQSINIGTNQTFDKEQVKVSFVNPRVNTNIEGSLRIFSVDVVIANKKYEGSDGLPNRVLANVIKDGKLIASEVLMENSENQKIHKGEQLTFTAKLHLFEGTDVKEIVYNPGLGIEKIIYPVIK
jgi:hypothetical protein